MRMPVHGLTVTPVVSLPHDRVMVFDSNGSAIDRRTGPSASKPMPAPAPAHTFTV